MSENKRYTYLDYSKDKYIGSFFCNGVILKNNEVVDILKEQEERIKELEKENEQLKQEFFESKKDYLIETYSDNPTRRDEKIQGLKEEFKERFGDV